MKGECWVTSRCCREMRGLSYTTSSPPWRCSHLTIGKKATKLKSIATVLGHIMLNVKGHNTLHEHRTPPNTITKKTLGQPLMCWRVRCHLTELHLYIPCNTHSKQLHHIPDWVWECPPVSHVALGVGEPLTSCCLRAWLQCNANLEPPIPLSPRLSPFPQLSPFHLPALSTGPNTRESQEQTICNRLPCQHLYPAVGLVKQSSRDDDTCKYSERTCLSC